MEKLTVTLGIDIGGTNTDFAFVDISGSCRHKTSVKTLSDTPVEHFVARIHETVDSLLNTADRQYALNGIGIGAANGNAFTGCIENAPNLGWKNAPIVALFQDAFGLPVHLNNDANAAALGEMLFGAARGMKSFILVTLGTGLGCGIVVHGQLLTGNKGHAGEMGHVTVEPNGRPCNCGKTGCLETYASATGIVRTAAQLLSESREDSALRRLPPQGLTGRTIADAAQSGDRIATRAFDLTGAVLGRSLADAVAYLDPEAIVISGGLASAGSVLFDPVREAFEENVCAVHKGNVNILPSGLHPGDAAIVGAAASIWKQK